MSSVRKPLILEEYDPMLWKALYEDTRNFYITVTLYLCCALITDYNIKQDPGFFEIILSVGLCTKLRMPTDLPKRIVARMTEILDAHTGVSSFDQIVIRITEAVRPMLPGIGVKFYVHSVGYYVTKNGTVDWPSVMGPLVWTWSHLTFANTKDINKRKTYMAVISILDFMVSCHICKNHFKLYKPTLFKIMTDDIEALDAENVMLDLHTFVVITIKNENMSFRDQIAVWNTVRNDARQLFRNQYRQLSSAIVSE